jgi:uncharacterized protein YbaP (TraB family)
MKFGRKSTALALFLAPISLWSVNLPASAKAKGAAPIAQSSADSSFKPALWTLKDDDTTIYLFGTIHALRSDAQWLTPALKAKLDASSELVLEVTGTDDAQNMQAKVMQHALNSSGKSLSAMLSDADRTAYHAALSVYAVPPTALDSFKPWYAATLLAMLPLIKAGYDPTQGAEAKLTEAAKAGNKRITALETIDQQMAIFGNLSDEEQLSYLKESVENHEEALTMIDEMVHLWRTGQEEAVGDLMNKSLETSPQLAEALLFRRNEIWAGQLQEKLQQPGTIFVAVGAGHLSGSRSVQDYLAKKGLKVERLQY